MEPVARNVILRHLSGTKANRIDQFALVDGLNVQLGRKPGSDVLYDSPRDDMVSREHASISLRDPAGPSFFLADNGSSNGTYVNGERLVGEREIFPDDVIELGRSGPKFAFDIQPRPENYAGRTRVMSVVDAATTRVLSASVDGETTPSTPLPKTGVGKETVERMLFEERRTTSRSWSAVAAGLLAFIVVGGGGLYWYSAQSAQKLRDEAAAAAKLQAEEAEKSKQEALASVAKELGTSARQVVERFGNATVRIDMRWGLYDRETDKPLFVKVFHQKDQDFLAFVQLDDGDIVPWLTLDDGARQNFRLSEGGRGSGFVVSSNGFVLTNKHVVAGWMVGFSWPSEYSVMVFKETKGANSVPGVPKKFSPDFFGAYSKWIPEREAGIVFRNATPSRISDRGRILVGRNEELEVRFPGSRLGMSAILVRASTDADAALIKVETPQTLQTVELAPNEPPIVGDRVTVLGYPGVSMEDRVVITTREMGASSTRREIVPQPTVTEGIISKTATAERRVTENVTAFSDLGGEVFQLGINTTGPGNSGGPVFNNAGRVIGFFTYGRNRGGIQVSFAVPIKFGTDLLQAQRTP